VSYCDVSILSTSSFGCLCTSFVIYFDFVGTCLDFAAEESLSC
jgi:hypothetical protein